MRLIYPLWKLKEMAKARIMHLDKGVFLQEQFIDYVVADGVKFLPTPELEICVSCKREYRLDDIRPDDVVIDIGANAGGVSLRLAKTAKRVLAVEPLVHDLLRKNIALNGFENVEVLPAGFGSGLPTYLSWSGKGGTIKTYTLKQLKDLADGCDFLKIDCEGCEWNLDLADLLSIRRLELEFHKIGNYQRFDEVMHFLERHFQVEFSPPSPHPVSMGYAHCWRKQRS
jgi:FkbM family methyltransferase